uniref:Uncharacterized protein n=1 Tax=Rhizophora mucronata TaxID=61149 RepID=A0A2P2N2R9_RHIMU
MFLLLWYSHMSMEIFGLHVSLQNISPILFIGMMNNNCHFPLL